MRRSENGEERRVEPNVTKLCRGEWSGAERSEEEPSGGEGGAEPSGV